VVDHGLRGPAATLPLGPDDDLPHQRPDHGLARLLVQAGIQAGAQVGEQRLGGPDLLLGGVVERLPIREAIDLSLYCRFLRVDLAELAVGLLQRDRLPPQQGQDVAPLAILALEVPAQGYFWAKPGHPDGPRTYLRV
jgi:hypothetical protein